MKRQRLLQTAARRVTRGASCFVIPAIVLIAECGAMAADGAADKERPNVGQTYSIRKAEQAPKAEASWDDPAWSKADTFSVEHFHAQSSDHRPKTQGRMLYTDAGVYIIFRVEDRYVVSVHDEYQDPVCRDSCVEFFVQPKPSRGYFNFEVNCGGTMLLAYHELNDKGEDVAVSVPEDAAREIKVRHSMPKIVSPEIAEATTWCVEYFVPFTLFERYIGPFGPIPGQSWRANFYKCADDSSHPHWAAWAPIGEKLSFHMPEYFGVIRFSGQ